MESVLVFLGKCLILFIYVTAIIGLVYLLGAFGYSLYRHFKEPSKGGSAPLPWWVWWTTTRHD